MPESVLLIPFLACLLVEKVAIFNLDLGDGTRLEKRTPIYRSRWECVSSKGRSFAEGSGSQRKGEPSRTWSLP